MKGYTPLFDREAVSAFWGPTRTRIVAGLAGGLALLSISSYYLTSPNEIYMSSRCGGENGLNRDPFSAAGYVHSDPANPLDINWIPLDETIRPAPDWVGKLRTAAGLPWPEIAGPQEQVEVDGDVQQADEAARHGKAEKERMAALSEIEHLRDSTILVIGDSVDRNLVIQTSELLGVRDRIRATQYTNIHDENTYDWDIRGLPHILHIDEPTVNFTLASCFIYGLDDHNEFEHQADWHAPGKAEDRIEHLCSNFTSQLAHQPSMIQLHSGLWDCTYFGRIDRRHPDPAVQRAETPLTREQMDWWQTRMASVIRMIKHTWPGVPIVYRKLHRTRSPEEAWAWTSGQEHLGFTNWFTDLRIAQIREMQDIVARAEGLRIWDFGHAWEGYQDFQDGVHPRTLPGGALMSRALLHHAYLAYQERAGICTA